MESRESSIHSLFALDTSHHGGIRIHSASSPPRPLTPLEDAQEQLQQRIRILGQPAAAFESQLLRAAVTAKPSCRNSDGFQLELLRLELCKLGYLVDLKIVTPEPSALREARHMLENLHHQYLLCKGTRSAPGLESCIIEPRCREQFQIAQATPAYQRVVRQIPEVFVGSPGRLHGLVSAVAPAMAEAFAAQNTPLPPWRKQLSMLTKWSLKGLQQQPPAVAAQPRRNIPAFARDLQALQQALDSGRIPPNAAAAAPDRMVDLSRQLASTQLPQPPGRAGQPLQHLQPAQPVGRDPTGAAPARQLSTHQESPPQEQPPQGLQLQDLAAPQQQQQTLISHCFGGPRTYSPPVPQPNDQQPADHPDHERSQRRGSRLAFLAPYLKRNSQSSTGDPSVSGHGARQPPAVEQKEGSKSRRRGARANVHVVKPLPELGGQAQQGGGPAFPWLWGGSSAEQLGRAAGAEGSKHDRSRRDSSKHSLSGQDRSVREGSKHDRSVREGSKHDSSTHEGSRHVHDISAQASPVQASQLFRQYEGQPVASVVRRQAWSPWTEEPHSGLFQDQQVEIRPASSLLAKALKKMVPRSGQPASDRSGSSRHPSRRGTQ